MCTYNEKVHYFSIFHLSFAASLFFCIFCDLLLPSAQTSVMMMQRLSLQRAVDGCPVTPRDSCTPRDYTHQAAHPASQAHIEGECRE